MDGQTICLRPFQLSDANELLKLQNTNKSFFERYSMTRVNNYYTLSYQEHLIDQFDYLRKQGAEYHFGIFTKESHELVGTTELFQLHRGSLQNAYVGYFVAKQHNGMGYATEACGLITTYAFQNLKLHRIEAGVMPRNIGSIRVLEKNGYQKEGIARKNVRINGVWEDHQVLANINPDDA